MVWHLPEPYGHVPFCKPVRKSSAGQPLSLPRAGRLQEGKTLTFYGWFVQGLLWEWEGGQAKHTQNFRDQSLVPDCRGRKKTNKLSNWNQEFWHHLCKENGRRPFDSTVPKLQGKLLPADGKMCPFREAFLSGLTAPAVARGINWESTQLAHFQKSSPKLWKARALDRYVYKWWPARVISWHQQPTINN